jgi:hypothetical protein
MPVKLNSSGGGSVTLTTPSTASDFTVTFPAATGNVVTTGSSAVVTQTMLAGSVAGNGPAFGAFQSSAQSLTGGGPNKILFQTEEFDTANCFASSRFTPNVAGYYQLNAAVQADNSASVASAFSIFKNGTLFKYGVYISIPSVFQIYTVSSLVYFNGTTDFAEIYLSPSGNIGTVAAQNATYFNGFLARAA